MKLKHILLTVAALGASVASAEGISYADWMSQLPDSTKVRNLSIPGSHDSASSGVGTTLGGAKTQAYKISEQWDKGARAFDLRPNKNMDIYHGIASCNTSMKDVFETVVSKISDSKEFAIFIIRYEEEADKGLLGTGKTDRPLFTSNLKSLLETYRDYTVEFSPSLKVKNVRGKIVVLVRDEFDSDLAASVRNYNSSQNLNDQKNASMSMGRTRVRLYVQDCFEYESNDVKQNMIKSMVDESSANTYYPMWVVNHTSGYQGTSSSDSKVKDNAKAMNAYLADYLTNNGVATRAADEVNGKTGIVLMDYAGHDDYSGQKLIDAVINQNQKYLTLGSEEDNDSDLETGVEEVGIDVDGEVEVYTVNGVSAGNSINNLEPGIYILRQGEKSSKIVVK